MPDQSQTTEKSEAEIVTAARARGLSWTQIAREVHDATGRVCGREYLRRCYGDIPRVTKEPVAVESEPAPVPPFRHVPTPNEQHLALLRATGRRY
jgi:hypothetical protein